MGRLQRSAALSTDPSDSALLFPGFTRQGALSENALLARVGYFGPQAAPGLRASFSTRAHEVQLFLIYRTWDLCGEPPHA